MTDKELRRAIADACRELLKRPASRRGPLVITDDELRQTLSALSNPGPGD